MFNTRSYSQGRMYGRRLIFVENFHFNNLSVVLEIFHVFNFRGTRVPTKIIYLEHFPIYGNLQLSICTFAHYYKACALEYKAN